MDIFKGLDLGGLQRVLFPVIDMLTGVDVQDLAAGKAHAFKAAGDGFSDVAGLCTMMGVALDDGILTNEEIDAIIADASDLDDAFDAIRDAIIGAPDEV